MKKFLFSTILFAFTLTVASAQMLTFGDTLLTISEELSDHDPGAYTAMTNVTQSTLDLRWERTSVEAPEEWDSWVCTVPGNCGLPATTTLDFEIGPGEVGEFQYHINPKDMVGMGTFIVDIVNNADDEVLQTIVINADMLPVSTNEIEEANIKMFPNPASDYFELTNSTIVDQVLIYNILGKQVKYFENHQGSYFIGDLSKGLYLVKLTDTDSDSVKTMRLKKN